MKIITWNCAMAFRKKAGLILAHNPDILIIPECEHPDKLTGVLSTSNLSGILWFGNNNNKGLAIISFNDFKLTVAGNHNQALKTIVPIVVSKNEFVFNLFAIWAFNPLDKDGHYVTQVWKAIHYYEHLLMGINNILIGDFNSNTIWDKKYRKGNHSHVVKYLEDKSIFSAYHLHHNQIQGSEAHPTFYLYRHRNKPYHLDYCFVSVGMAKQLKAVEVGAYDFWTRYSDHVPVIVTFD
jgi:exodeoxyribonuclease-3